MQLKGISSLLKMCWVYISVQETVKSPSVRPVPRESTRVRNGWRTWFPRLWVRYQIEALNQTPNQTTQRNGWKHSIRWSWLGGAGLKGDRMCSIYEAWFKMLNTEVGGGYDFFNWPEQQEIVSFSGRIEIAGPLALSLVGDLRNLFCHQEALLEVMWQGRFEVDWFWTSRQ